MAERDYTNDYDDYLRNNPYEYQGKPEPNGWSVAPPRTQSPQEIADELRHSPGWTNPNQPPNAPPPTGPKSGDRRPSPRGPEYFEEFNGTTWVTYDTPGGGQPNTGDPGGGQSTDPYVASSGAGVSAPQINFDPYQSAGPFQPRDDTFEFTPFSHDPYTASSWEDAEKEPGYDASRKQLKGQIEGGAAYRGMLRSGMTLRDIYTGLDSLGQQNFANFDNRRFRNYSANRDGAFRAWSGNLNAAAQKFGLELGVDRDIYDRGATNVDRQNNYNFNTRQAQSQDALARWQEQVRSLTQISTAGMNS